MERFSNKLRIIAGDTNFFLEKIFSKKNKYSYLIKPMMYGVFSGGKRYWQLKSCFKLNPGRESWVAEFINAGMFHSFFWRRDIWHLFYEA